MWHAPAAVLVVALSLAGCSSSTSGAPTPVDDSPPPETIREGSVTLSGGEQCTNEQDGYRIRYPSAWFTNDGSGVPACMYFDVEPVAVEPGQLPFDLGAVLGTAPVQFEEYVNAISGVDVDERTTTQVAGRDAVIIRGRGNGDALIPEGTQVHRYIVELPDDAVLLASTYDTGDLPFARKIAVLDGMMGTLELTGNDVAPSPS